MSKFLRNIIIVAALVGIFTVPALATSHVGAIDIFSNCTSDPGVTDKASCADCQGSAQGTDVCKDIATQQNGNQDNPIISVIKAAIDLISKIVGIAAVIGIIASGIRLIIANGDSNSVATARSGLVYCLIGVAVTVLAQIIVVFVLKDVK